MPFKNKDIPEHNMIPNPEDFIMFYEKYDEINNSNIWRFIELSLCGAPIQGDNITVPYSDTDNKNKYIVEHLKECVEGPYVCIKNSKIGVWNHKKHKFYEFIDQIGIRDEIIEYLLKCIYNHNYFCKKDISIND